MIRYTEHVPDPCEEDIITKYVDDDILVLEKPSGLLTVPGRIVKDSVLTRVLPTYRTATVVHRLDLDTSGLLVLSLSKEATRELNRKFREREVLKEYAATAFGVFKQPKGEISLGIRPDPVNRPKQVIDSLGGKPACTRYELLRVHGGHSELLLTPLTGRSHQLRIHLAAVGHPILGCDLYAHEEARQLCNRLQLHAAKIIFQHPITQKPMSFSSQVPF